MALDEPQDEDQVFTDRALTYVIDKELFEKVKPIKIDYVNSQMGSGFSISSSMPRGSCNC
jgi:Fe-S cluster assembly iron-binding protein IscA